MSPHFIMFGTPVRVHPSFWLGAAVLGYLYYRVGPTWAIIPWIPIVFLAVLLHELGHALAFRAFGVDSMIVLFAGGGQTQPTTSRVLTPGRQFMVSFAGPFVGLVIGGAALLTTRNVPLPPVAGIIFDAIVWTNLGWAIFNLLPVLPLDGGHMMAAVFYRVAGPRGARAARVASMVVAGALAALGLAYHAYFIAIFMALYLWENYRAWQMESQWVDGVRAQVKRAPVAKAKPAPSAPTLADEIKRAWGKLEEGDAAAVRRIAEPLVARVRTDDDRFDVAHLVAWGRLLDGDARGAAAALELLPPGARPDALIEGAVKLETGSPEAAVAPLAEAVRTRPDDFVATRLARAVARSGRFDEVTAILESAEASEEVGCRPLQMVVIELALAGMHVPAATLGKLLVARFSQANDAFNVACALGQAGEASEAIEWLERAVELGLADPTVLDTDDDLAPVRALPAFATIREKAGL